MRCKPLIIIIRVYKNILRMKDLEAKQKMYSLTLFTELYLFVFDEFDLSLIKKDFVALIFYSIR